MSTLATEQRPTPDTQRAVTHRASYFTSNLLAVSRFLATVKSRGHKTSHRRTNARTAFACSCFPCDVHSTSFTTSAAHASVLLRQRALAILYPDLRPTHLPSLAACLHAKAKPKLRSQCLRLTLQAQHESLPLLPGRTDEPNGFGRHIPRRREKSEETCRA